MPASLLVREVPDIRVHWPDIRPFCYYSVSVPNLADMLNGTQSDIYCRYNNITA